MERRTGIERRMVNLPNWRPLPFSPTLVGIDEQVRPAAAERRTGKDRRRQDVATYRSGATAPHPPRHEG